MKNKSTLVSKNSRAYWKETLPLYTARTLTVKKNDGLPGAENHPLREHDNQRNLYKHCGSPSQDNDQISYILTLHISGRWG